MALSETRSLEKLGRTENQKIAWLLVIVPLLVFCLYTVTLCPQIFWRDAPEFVATSHTLSISHPAGSPTYNLLVKGFTFLPIGGVAFRVHLGTAFFGAMAVFALLLVMMELYLLMYHKDPNRLQWWGMALLAALFGVSLSFWKFSITSEVYTLQDFLFLLVLWLGLRFYRAGDVRLFFTGAFIYGLSLGAHIVNGLFFIPFFLLGLSKRHTLRYLGIVVFFFLLGFSVYLYLPLRFEKAPLKLGYNANNLENTFKHMTVQAVLGKKKKKYAEAVSLKELYGTRALLFLEKLLGQVSYVGFALGLIGIGMLVIRQPFIALMLIMMWMFYAVCFYNWKPFGLLPVYLIWMIWAAVGMNALLGAAERLRWEKGRFRARLVYFGFPCVLLCGLVVQIGMSFARNLQEDELSDFYIGYDLGAYLLDSLDLNSTLITQYSNPHFLIFYLQEVEGYRKDVKARQIATFINDEHLMDYVSSRLNRDLPIFIVASAKINTFYKQLVPHGVVFRFKKGPVSLHEEDLREHLKLRTRLEKRLSGDRYQDELETFEELFRISSELHRYYHLAQSPDIAEEELRSLASVNPTSPFLNMFLAIVLYQTGENDEARAALMRCQERLETLRGRQYMSEKRYLYYNAGVMALEARQYSLAEYFLNQAVAVDPTDEYIRYFLALTLFQEGKLQEAERHARIASKLEKKEDNTQLLEEIEKALSRRDGETPMKFQKERR
jgi:tetratricopeptide (TPR) repeat protein